MAKYLLYCIAALTLTFRFTKCGAAKDPSDPKSIFCYYTMRSNFREDPLAKFLPENIDPFLCTHIVYSFARPRLFKTRKSKNSKSRTVKKQLRLIPSERNLELPQVTGFYERVVSLKKINPDLKVILSVTS